MAHKVSTRTYRLLYATLGQLIKWFFPVRIKGAHLIPPGPAIFVSPHKAVIDSYVILVALEAWRSVKIPAKAEYFLTNGKGNLKERVIYFLVKQVGIRVDRDDHESGRAALDAMVGALNRGESVVIHPEGTRVLGEDVCKAKTGFVRAAWETGVPVIPVVLRGTAAANPPSVRRLYRHEITVEFLEPIQKLGSDDKVLAAVRKFGTEEQAKRREKKVMEHQACAVMELFAKELGVHYIDEFASVRQKRVS